MRGGERQPGNQCFGGGFTPAVRGGGPDPVDDCGTEGSPPRVRGGGVAATSPGKTRHGFTPACAGRGPAPGGSSSLRRVHPRVCGEGTYRERDVRLRVHPRVCGEGHVWVMAVVAPLGSPPRVRGGAVAPASPLRHQGSPPRVRGGGPSFGDRWGSGSPPRVRGGDPGALVGDGHGVHPPCAGRGIDHQRQTRTLGSPRVCGEGALTGRSDLTRLCGFTPTCAGRGGTFPVSTQPCKRVHPRVCGEEGRFS